MKSSHRNANSCGHHWRSPHNPWPSLSFFEITHFLYLFLTIPIFLSLASVMRLFCEADAPFYSCAPFVLFIWQVSPPVLSRVISALLQIALPPVWGSDPSQGSPLNLILIVTSVINRHGLGGDYSLVLFPLFPLFPSPVRPWAVIPVSIRREANTQLCSSKDLVTLEKKLKGLPLFPCERSLISSGRP